MIITKITLSGLAIAGLIFAIILIRKNLRDDKRRKDIAY